MKRAIGLGIIALAICFASMALAQTDAEKKLARKHYELGEQFYKISNYPKALAEFTDAYKLYPLPSLLFNIARCHEVMANLEQALKYYRLYLEKVPSSPKRSLIEARIKTLRVRLDARKPTPAPKPGTEPAPEPATRPATMPAVSPPVIPPDGADTPATPWGWKKTAGWAAVGVGGASLVGGIILGSLAASKASEYQDAYYADLEGIEETGEAYEVGQIALLVVGGAAVAAGCGLLLWHHFDRDRGEDAPMSGAVMAPYATAGGGGIMGRIRF